jgi:hypothetical protein
MMAIAAQRPVAAGMTAYVHLRLRLRVFGLDRVSTEPAEIDAAASAWIERAHGDERPIEPLLEGPERRTTLQAALARALGRGACDPVVERLAVELEDAHSE